MRVFLEHRPIRFKVTICTQKKKKKMMMMMMIWYLYGFDTREIPRNLFRSVLFPLLYMWILIYSLLFCGNSALFKTENISLCIYQCSMLLRSWSSSAGIKSMHRDLHRFSFTMVISASLKPVYGVIGLALYVFQAF